MKDDEYLIQERLKIVHKEYKKFCGKIGRVVGTDIEFLFEQVAILTLRIENIERSLGYRK